MRTMLIALVYTQVMAFPAPVSPSCESIVSVQSRELDFRCEGSTPSPAFEDRRREHFRALAHAVAMAQACQDTARLYSSEAGTAPRTGIRLLAGRLLAVDPGESNASGILRRCARADFDSSCVLWTCEIGRFNSQEGAAAAAVRFQPQGVLDDEIRSFDPARDATLRYVTCAGNWEPGSFVIRLDRVAVAPWSTRVGLYFTREDALRAAREFQGEMRRPVRVLRQVVDGPLLEQALREPLSEC